MIMSLPLIDVLQLRLSVSTHVNHQLINKLIKYVPIESYKLFKESIGLVFELFICSIYHQAAKSLWRINTDLNFHGNKFEHSLSHLKK